jgi:putative ABC transport system permease protein
MTNLIHDCRYALRQLRKSPGFAMTVVLTLALSVGVATAVFCVIDAVILRPLPYANQDRIVAVESRSPSGYTQPASWPSYQDERKQVTAFSALAGYWDWESYTMTAADGTPVSLRGIGGTDNFFDVFGMRPVLGRTFLPGEEVEGKNTVVVLSYEVWQKHFNGDAGIAGRPVRLNDKTYTVIGVMPAGFRFPLNVRDAVYTPLSIDKPWKQHRGTHWLRTIGRVKDSLTIEQAQADLQHVFANLGAAYSEDKGRTVTLQKLADNVNAKTRGPLWTLLGAVFAVLAIGCVNVAGLLLARGVKREREMAMRVALGAARQRLLGQLLTEGVMLALVGAAGGIGLAWILLRLMRAFLAHALARGMDVHLNWIVLGASIAVAITASLIASLYPALRLSGVDPNRALKAGGSAGTERSQHRLRSGFVVCQVALTLVLLVVAGLLLRVVSRYRHAELGFDAAHIVEFPIEISRMKYAGQDVIGGFYRPLEERLQRAPGIAAAGLISMVPIDSWGSNTDVHLAGQPPARPNEERLAEVRTVSAGYFDVMGIPLHAGRWFSPGIDGPETGSKVVVNDAFVKKFMPQGMDPLAQRMDDQPKQENWTRIIGVAGNVRQNIYAPPLAEMDYLMDSMDVKERADGLSTMMLLVRSKGDPEGVIPEVRAILHDLDPTVPFEEPSTMTKVVADALVFERMESWLFGIFAGLALTLAMVGLYGLVSHEVEQGTRDIGVRMALGATRSGILAMVVRRVAWMLGAGALVGLLLTVSVQRVIGMVIYFEVQKEAGSFVLLALLLIAAGLVAAFIPAMQAASVEPMQALRSE